MWFRDGRRPTNHARALQGWYSPEGLEKLLAQDVAAAEAALVDRPVDFPGLRYYQREAVEAVEEAVRQGRQEALLAMATGTGKTRTALALLYRLIKHKRFRRILFLVDRTALGEQAMSAFEEVKLEGALAFADTYDVKALGDLDVDPDTRVHIATVQSLVKRVLNPEDGAAVPPVDQYDCIVVDECHRGYVLDREMSDAELTFRSEAEYVSKYRRVMEYFDAVRIGLTATPALHTVEIFGRPVYAYSYRQAVLDGYLVDHLPPTRITTRLAEDGIHWEAGEEVYVFDPKTGQLDLTTAPRRDRRRGRRVQPARGHGELQPRRHRRRRPRDRPIAAGQDPRLLRDRRPRRPRRQVFKEEFEARLRPDPRRRRRQGHRGGRPAGRAHPPLP